MACISIHQYHKIVFEFPYADVIAGKSEQAKEAA